MPTYKGSAIAVPYSGGGRPHKRPTEERAQYAAQAAADRSPIVETKEGMKHKMAKAEARVRNEDYAPASKRK